MIDKIKKYSRLIGIVIFVIILATIDWEKTLQIIKKADPLLILFATILFPFFVLLKAVRWHILLKGQGTEYSLKSCFLVYLSSNYLGVLTPGRIGELSKIFYLKQDTQLSYTRGFSNVLADRLFDIVIMVVFACTGIFFFFRTYWLSTFLVIVLFILLIIVVIAYLRTLDTMIKRVLYRKNRHKIYSRLKIFFLSLVTFHTKTIMYSFGLTILGFSIFFTIINLLAYSLRIQNGILFIPLSVSIASLVSMIPISVSGLGLRDLSLIVIFRQVGFSPETAVSFSILFLFYFTGLWTLFGWIAWNITPFSSSARSIEEKMEEVQ